MIINSTQWNTFENSLTTYTKLYFMYGYNKMKAEIF